MISILARELIQKPQTPMIMTVRETRTERMAILNFCMINA